MIRNLLVANRGEVAGRVFATCRRLGIRTVAVYSEADRDALFVRMADQAVYLGPAPSEQSYLNIPALLRAAQTSGADAIHPGYGFLAENADFARQVRAQGLAFVGPEASVIEAMGSKVAARELCRSVGVPTVPGSGALDDQGLLAWADQHGYPVMLKASAGGGGKGMRRLNDRASLIQALDSARREALKAFGSDSLYLERAVERARHLEVQVVGDKHGKRLHLGIRECSLQRRHQKIIEECPPAQLSETLAHGLTEAALRLAEKVDYTSLGTVEFLVDGEQYYFLEMNTRLQVEHPVTEMVTGLDLVELQLRIEENEPLTMHQSELRLAGHAIEARLTCEEPHRGFLPAIGTVLEWRPGHQARFDTTLEKGATVSPHYDSMVAKAIVWGETRTQALRLLDATLASTVLLGVAHNIDYLRHLLSWPEVQAGELHTSLVEERGYEAPDLKAEQLLAATAVRWARLTGGVAESGRPVNLQFEGHPRVKVSGQSYHFEGGTFAVKLGHGGVEIDHHRLPVVAAVQEDDYWIHSPLGTARLTARPRFPMPGRSQAEDDVVRAPMPGSLVEVTVSEGQEVESGQTVAKLEAMKMEQILVAPRSGRVEKVHFRTGDQVEAGSVLISFSL